jgi:hypothetical protein
VAQAADLSSPSFAASNGKHSRGPGWLVWLLVIIAMMGVLTFLSWLYWTRRHELASDVSAESQ